MRCDGRQQQKALHRLEEGGRCQGRAWGLWSKGSRDEAEESSPEQRVPEDNVAQREEVPRPCIEAPGRSPHEGRCPAEDAQALQAGVQEAERLPWSSPRLGAEQPGKTGQPNVLARAAGLCGPLALRKGVGNLPLQVEDADGAARGDRGPRGQGHLARDVTAAHPPARDGRPAARLRVPAACERAGGPSACGRRRAVWIRRISQGTRDLHQVQCIMRAQGHHRPVGNMRRGGVLRSSAQ
mmetsp:Transcript_7129/g.21812  ORF Transcript_7129/g.21812 Transcript_7129/m.21812 type:complete len:239 (+) Transcript_7129:1069-1785(+)